MSMLPPFERMHVRHKGRYAAIGYVVSKVVMPVAKRQAKKSARRKARGAVTGSADAMRRNPARTSVAFGAAAGAVGWLMTRRRSGGDEDASPSSTEPPAT